MLTNAEINPLASDETPPPGMPAHGASESDALSYRDRLNRWAIARIDAPQTQVIVARFRSHSDAEGHLRFLRQKFPVEKFIIVFEKQGF